MVPVTALWLPILVSAVFVFIASSIIHMVLPIHRTDWKRIPDEDGLLDSVRALNLPPGDYCAPRANAPRDMKNPTFIAKLKRGPVVMMTVRPGGDFSMGSKLAQWFVFAVVVSLFAGYLAGAALGPGAEYLEVFRFSGTTAFAAYTLAFVPQSIWYEREWSMQAKNMFDGLVYALLTAGVFGWLWP